MTDTIRYKETVKLLAKGDVILSFNTENKLSDIIANVTKSKYSHVMMYIGNGNVVESSIHGVAITPFKHYIQPHYNIRVLSPIMSDDKKEQVVKESLALLGKKYGYLHLVWYAFLRLIRQSENPKFQLDLNPNKLVCSEAIATAYANIGKSIKGQLKPSQIEPVDFQQSGRFKTILVWPPKVSKQKPR
jgi:uncharacterized protein YycO